MFSLFSIRAISLFSKQAAAIPAKGGTPCAGRVCPFLSLRASFAVKAITVMPHRNVSTGNRGKTPLSLYNIFFKLSSKIVSERLKNPF